MVVTVNLKFEVELCLDIERSKRFSLAARESLDVTIVHDFLNRLISFGLSFREILYFFLLTTKELGIQLVSNVVLTVEWELTEVAVNVLDMIDGDSLVTAPWKLGDPCMATVNTGAFQR